MERVGLRYALHANNIRFLPTQHPGTKIQQVGGDSLNCVRLVGRFNSVFGASISVQSIFEHPTIASQCELLQESGLLTLGTTPSYLHVMILIHCL